jgi:hypothetical protein
VTYDNNVGESPQEEGPAEVLPEAGLVLGVVGPWFEQLEIWTLRELLDECLIHRCVRDDPEVQIRVAGHLGWIFGRVGPGFLVIRSWGDYGVDDIRVEEEAGEHGLLEGEEEQHEDDGVDDGDDVLRPSPSDCVGDRSARD